MTHPSSTRKPPDRYNPRMPRISAGLLMYRRRPGGLEVLLVHPGGPFWKNKDAGAWSIPKGEVEEGEDRLTAARREFAEELGFAANASGRYVPLTPVKQKSGKVVHAWAFEGDCDPSACKSNTMRMLWPPKSGKWITVPEVDQAEFFDLPTARAKINPAQAALLAELAQALKVRD
jgi:predicted NUDIX family NTP pyrophosphohydrolase